MTKIVISSDSSTPVAVLESDSEFVLNESVTLSAAIIATGTATNRDFYVNGTVTTASGFVFDYGDDSFTDTQSQFIVSSSGTVSGGENGLDIDGGGLQLANQGTISARLTAIDAAGETTQIVNNGLIASSAGVGIAASGGAATITNHGAIRAETIGVQLSGAGAGLTNNGELRSATGTAVASSGSGAVLTNHGTILAQNAAILSTGTGAIITNDGKVTSTAGYAINARGFDATVTNSGTLIAGKSAIVVTGDSGTVTNDGMIKSAAYAVTVVADDAIVTNNRTIFAGAGVKLDGVDGTLTNRGTITGTITSAAAIDFSDAARSSLNNAGLIASKSLAFEGGGGVQSVFNSGTIKGSIKLGGGNDYFDGTGGKVSGTVHGGSGNDVYVISDATIKLSELARGGSDLVKTAVSFTLGSNFEKMTLTGAANINGTGNALANQLHGNSGKNVIKGLAGNDTIWGHGGADILTGGAGVDQFVFNTGDGKDTITDFTAAGSRHDILDITGLSSVTSYSDLARNHMKQVGGDVLIDGLNGDSILLKAVKLSSLDAGDFLF